MIVPPSNMIQVTGSFIPDEHLIDEAYSDRLLEAITTPKDIFRLSFENYDGEIYEPMVPIRRAIGENSSIPRVCFADTIEGAFRAMPNSSKYVNNGCYYDGDVFKARMYVHTPEYDYDILDLFKNGYIAYPNEKLVPDTYITQEVWVMNTVKLRCVGIIDIWFNASTYLGWSTTEELPVKIEIVDTMINHGTFIDWIHDCPKYVESLYEDD